MLHCTVEEEEVEEVDEEEEGEKSYIIYDAAV